MLGGPRHGASSRIVEQANIRALKGRHLLFGTISTFQVARVAVPSHRFRCLREIHVPAHWWCCIACSSFGWCIGWGYFSLVFCWAVLPGLLFWVLLRFSSSFQWCCLPFTPLGRGALPPHMKGWVLGCWAFGSGVGWLGLALVFGC